MQPFPDQLSGSEYPVLPVRRIDVVHALAAAVSCCGTTSDVAGSVCHTPSPPHKQIAFVRRTRDSGYLHCADEVQSEVLRLHARQGPQGRN